MNEATVELAYRAFCEARAGRAMPDAEYNAIRSRVEYDWLRAVVAAVEGSHRLDGAS